MKRIIDSTALILTVVTIGITFLTISGCNGSGSDSVANSSESVELAQVTTTETETDGTAAADTEESTATAEVFDVIDASEAPEMTAVSGHLVLSDGSSASGGALYFVFQNRLNEIPHTNPLEKVRAMAEETAVIDDEGSFSLVMKPGNFAMVYDPEETDPQAGPGPESMAVMQKFSPDQVQARIAAIKENAAKGLPIENGRIGRGYIVENRFVRPPIANFGDIQLQDNAVATILAVDANGEPINFPATLRLRGKNGDILEPHTPSISTRATYTFHDLEPQSYQVFALGSLPRPGGGDEITTPTVSNDQFVFADESITHEVLVELPE